MISKSITTSLKLSRCKTDHARLLFTWMIPHADDKGRLQGDVNFIKGLIFPMLKHTIKRISKFLEDLSENNLIIWYGEKGGNIKYIQVINFMKFQTLQADRVKPSDIPEYDANIHIMFPECLQKVSKCNPNINEYNISEDKLNEENEAPLDFCKNFTTEVETEFRELCVKYIKINPKFNIYKFLNKEFKIIFKDEKIYFPKQLIVHPMAVYTGMKSVLRYLNLKKDIWAYLKFVIEKNSKGAFEADNIAHIQSEKKKFNEASFSPRIKNLISNSIKGLE